MAKLTKDQALDGLKKLHALTKDTATTTRKELQKVCGLRLTDMLVLAENDIISCIGKRPTQWKWMKDVVPNAEMASTMLSTKVKAWYDRKEKTEPAPETAATELNLTSGSTQEDTPHRKIPGVKVYRKFEITKKYGDDVFSMFILETPKGWEHSIPIEVLNSASSNILKAVGYALVTASEIMDQQD